MGRLSPRGHIGQVFRKCFLCLAATHRSRPARHRATRTTTPPARSPVLRGAVEHCVSELDCTSGGPLLVIAGAGTG
jgi:hypothetical protein